MAIPRFSDFFSVVLNEMYDAGGESSYKTLRQKCIDKFGLTEEEIVQQLPSGQSRLSNRIYWTISYCRMAGLVATVENERGKIKLTDDGLAFVKTHGTVISPPSPLRIPTTKVVYLLTISKTVHMLSYAPYN